MPFVRTPANSMPFNSVDLSLPSSSLSAVAAPAAHTNRNSLTPSPRTQISPVPASSTSNHRFSKHQNDNEDSSANNGANHNKLNPDPIAFLHEMSEQLASMRSNRSLTASANFARDSNSFSSDLSNFRNNGGNDKVTILICAFSNFDLVYSLFVSFRFISFVRSICAVPATN